MRSHPSIVDFHNGPKDLTLTQLRLLVPLSLKSRQLKVFAHIGKNFWVVAGQNSLTFKTYCLQEMKMLMVLMVLMLW